MPKPEGLQAILIEALRAGVVLRLATSSDLSEPKGGSYIPISISVNDWIFRQIPDGAKAQIGQVRAFIFASGNVGTTIWGWFLTMPNGTVIESRSLSVPFHVLRPGDRLLAAPEVTLRGVDL